MPNPPAMDFEALLQLLPEGEQGRVRVLSELASPEDRERFHRQLAEAASRIPEQTDGDDAVRSLEDLIHGMEMKMKKMGREEREGEQHERDVTAADQNLSTAA